MNNTVKKSYDKPMAWGGISCVIWGILIALGFVFTQIVVYGVYLAVTNSSGISEAELLHNGNILAYSSISSATVTLLLISIAIVAKKYSQFKDYLALQMASVKQHVIWIGITAIMLVSYGVIAWYFKIPEPPFMQQVYQSADPKWLLWIAVGVAAPLSEEVFFRGFLLRSYLTSHLSKFLAVIITSAIWASIHIQYDWALITLIFLLGLILGAARIQSKSLILPIIIHTLWNLLAMLETASKFSTGL